MNINIENPLIRLAAKKQDFNYERLFTATFTDYIMEYKNTRYEDLIDKDKSIALARIIKKLEVNGVPVTEFFAEELEVWSEKFDNFGKNLQLVNLMARDMFCCFDPNLVDENGAFQRVRRIYAVNNNGTRDYVAYQDAEKRSLFGKKPKSAMHTYFAELIELDQGCQLPRSKAAESKKPML
ncbi:MAG: hypothetical protein QM689_06400 [Oscillospiraceae bacterium]